MNDNTNFKIEDLKNSIDNIWENKENISSSTKLVIILAISSSFGFLPTCDFHADTRLIISLSLINTFAPKCSASLVALIPDIPYPIMLIFLFFIFLDDILFILL